ncbi:hypothetical protein F5H01DRAFT_8898 [Linnemannia elongata]|nr:hypothetical protein F5H01DRAFT_8898 [Linnemannia elongata]
MTISSATSLTRKEPFYLADTNRKKKHPLCNNHLNQEVPPHGVSLETLVESKAIATGWHVRTRLRAIARDMVGGSTAETSALLALLAAVTGHVSHLTTTVALDICSGLVTVANLVVFGSAPVAGPGGRAVARHMADLAAPVASHVSPGLGAIAYHVSDLVASDASYIRSGLFAVAGYVANLVAAVASNISSWLLAIARQVTLLAASVANHRCGRLRARASLMTFVATVSADHHLARLRAISAPMLLSSIDTELGKV